MTRARVTSWISGLAAVLCLALGPGAMAQGLFSPAIKINDRAITQYEIEQRTLFLQVLRAPGDLRETAVEQLIDDRLRREAAAELSLTITEEETLEAMSEFAARAELTREQFLEE